MGGNGNAPPEQQHEQQHHGAGPHKAQFLADDGEDEVVLGFGHKQMLLAAVPQPQPGGSAGADGVQALDGLVAIPQRVSKRVLPGAQAVGSVGHKVRHNDHRRPDGGRPAQACQHEPPQTCAAHEHQHCPDAQDQQSARKMGFQQHQRRHHPQHQHKGQHPHRKAAHPVMVQRDDVRKHQHHRKFCDLAWLQGTHPRQHQPPFAAVVFRHKKHHRKQHQRDPQQRPGQFVENVIVHPAGQPQPRNAHGSVEQLGAQVGKGIAPPVKGHRPRRTAQHHQPEPHQREYQHQKRQVHGRQSPQRCPVPPACQGSQFHVVTPSFTIVRHAAVGYTDIIVTLCISCTLAHPLRRFAPAPPKGELLTKS